MIRFHRRRAAHRPVTHLFMPLWIAITFAAVACGFVVVIGTGFALHDQRPPEMVAATFRPAIVTLAAIVVGLAVTRPFAWTRPPRLADVWARRRSRRRFAADRIERAEAARTRLVKLRVDPLKRPYAERIAAGEHWSDEQIAYDLDPAMLATCPHLRPIERAMRVAGLRVRYLLPSEVAAECRVDEPSLIDRYRPPPSVAYVERYDGERAAQDFAIASVACVACHAMIRVRHPDEATAATPWFPAAPPIGGRPHPRCTR